MCWTMTIPGRDVPNWGRIWVSACTPPVEAPIAMIQVSATPGRRAGIGGGRCCPVSAISAASAAAMAALAPPGRGRTMEAASTRCATSRIMAGRLASSTGRGLGITSTAPASRACIVARAPRAVWAEMTTVGIGRVAM